jgi:periplasmic protein TonB
VFTKLYTLSATSYFIDSKTVTSLGEMTQGKIDLKRDRSWIAFVLVLCGHLAVFAALHPQPLVQETLSEPIMVSLVSAPQPAPPASMPMPPEKAITTMQKHAKQPQAIRKAPIKKTVVQRTKPSTLSDITPVEQSSKTTNTSDSTQPPTKTNAKASDTPTYQPVSFNAAYLHNPAPNYPAISRRLGEQGKVLLRVQVTLDGAASLVELQTSSGSSRLDHSALEAVKKWRFVPAKRGGLAVSASVIVPVSFSIEG